MSTTRLLVLIPVAAFAAACGCLGAGCGGSTHDHASHSHAAEEPAQAAQYTCPMHTDVLSNAPGNCPKCGMALVAKE